MTREEFVETLKKDGIELDARQIEQFETYLHLLQEWNQKMNLTAIDEEGQIWEKHFYDSLRPFIGTSFETLADVGSGAGFPGIPLQIVYPQRKITLIEPLQKRCTFLGEVKERLGLDNLEIVNDRAELFAREHRENYEVLSARAVARLPILMELCAPLLQKDGLFIALKGSQASQELEEAAQAMKILGLELEKQEEYTIGDEEKRGNLFFRKVASTPARYPRAYGQIKKKPLGA